MDTLSISEIFGPTLQGEGHLIGAQTVFVRTGGCDYRCRWCDTWYAVDPKYKADWQKKDSQSVMQEIMRLSDNKPMWVTLSGGNPALQDFSELIRLGQAKGYQFAMETQGSVSASWFERLDHLVLSPKPPSSDMTLQKDKFFACLDYISDEKISIKVVIADKQDLSWAFDLYQKLPNYAWYLQPCNPLHEKQKFSQQQALDGVVTLHQWVNELNWSAVRILPQLHYLLWDGERGY